MGDNMSTLSPSLWLLPKPYESPLKQEEINLTHKLGKISQRMDVRKNLLSTLDDQQANFCRIADHVFKEQMHLLNEKLDHLEQRMNKRKIQLSKIDDDQTHICQTVDQLLRETVPSYQ